MCRCERCAEAARDAGERPQVSGWNESRKRSVRAVPRKARSNEMAFPVTEHSEQRYYIYPFYSTDLSDSVMDTSRSLFCITRFTKNANTKVRATAIGISYGPCLGSK